MTPTTYFRTPKVRLRALEPEDLALLYTIENDSELWDVTAPAQPFSRYALRQYIAQQSGAGFFEAGQLRLVVVGCDGPQEECVGLVDLFNYAPADARAEVGIALLRQHRQRGFGRDALHCLAHYAVSFLHLHQLYAHVPLNNSASRSLFEAAGYKEIAVLPQWHFAGGKYEDTLLFHQILG